MNRYYSRKCAGWSAADNMETPLVLRAAQRALADLANADTDGTIHHSDRGSQYASEMFRGCSVTSCRITKSLKA